MFPSGMMSLPLSKRALSVPALSLLVLSVFRPSPVRGAEPPLRLDLGGGVMMELVHIEPGTFTQGSPATEAGRGADEQQREVTITKPFYIGRYPVTRAQWERFAVEKSYRSEAEDGTSGGYGWDGQKLTQKKEYTWRNPGFAQTGEHPVTLVTWPDAQAFLKWMGTRTGRVCTLPTEAQWEYACRAGTTTPWPLADADEWAWHKGNAQGATHPVGQKKANARGLMDMGGQVWEWCQDWYGPWNATAVTDPLQTNDKLSDKPRRVLRGGSFIKDINSTRSATRYRNDPRSRNADNGFRVAVDVSAVTPSGAPKPSTLPPAPTLPAERPAEAPDPPIRTPNTISPPVPDSPGTPHDGGHGTATTSQSNSGSSSGASGWIALLLGIPAVAVLWMIIRRVMFKRGDSPRPDFRQWSSGPGGGAGAAAAPVVRIGRDGFWITGHIPPGTPVFWNWRSDGQVLSGQGEFQPGPEGMFIFTGAAPEEARAWLENAAPADDPAWMPTDGTGYRTGVQAGMLQEQLRRERERESDRERERERERQRDREEEERRRRRRDDDDDFRRQSHTTASRPSSGFPSAY